MGKASRRRKDRVSREQRQREVGEARIEAHREQGWPIDELLAERDYAKVTVELADGPTLTGVLSSVELRTESEGIVVKVDLAKPAPDAA